MYRMKVSSWQCLTKIFFFHPQVFGNAPPNTMTEKFSDLLQFTTQVSRLMVTEIRRRASNKSTGIFTETSKNYLNRLFGKSAIKIKEKIEPVLSTWVLITCPSLSAVGWFNISLQVEQLYSRTSSLDLPSPPPLSQKLCFLLNKIQIPTMTFKADPRSGHMNFFFKSMFYFLFSIFQPNEAACSREHICVLIFILYLWWFT